MKRMVAESTLEDEQELKVPFKVNLQQAIIDGSKALDELTLQDKEAMKEEQDREVELAFPSYFDQLQKALVLMDNESPAQIARDDLKSVRVEEVFGELCAVDDKGEVSYRTKYLQTRVQTVVQDIAINRGLE